MFTTEEGVTPLHIAAQNGHLAIVQSLLELRFDPGSRSTDLGKTPLELAVENDHSEVVALLQFSS